MRQFSRGKSRPVHYDTRFPDSSSRKEKRLAVDSASRCNFQPRVSGQLPVSTPVGTAAAVKAASTVKTPTAVETARTPSESASHRSVGETAAASSESGPATSEAGASHKSWAITKSGASNEAASAKAGSAEATMAEEFTPPTEAAEPRAGANKDATNEPIRSVVAIRRASVRVIPVVAISAGRRIPVWANPNANHDLRLGRRCRWEHQN